MQMSKYAKKVLVTGGAGYIGAITSRLLSKEGYEPIIFDNFDNGVREAVGGFEIIEGDLRDYEAIYAALHTVRPRGVIHFAALKGAGESMEIPEEYYQNNVGGSVNLFKAMEQTGVRNIVFSSSAAVYGQPDKNPIHEDDPTIPTTVYGHTKLQVEEVLAWLGKLNRMASIRLRYFNVAGALEDGTLGEASPKLLNIIPLIIETARKKRTFTLFGNDYPTPDGTCIRDYIDVVDLARAHILAYKRLFDIEGSEYYNVGVGKGYSNLELIQMVKEISGVDFEYTVGLRREGDPAQFFADNSKITNALGWKPECSIRDSIQHAWNWHNRKD